MRNFINIVENVSIVYHGGGRQFTGQLYFPFFVSRDIEVAESYAIDRGGEVYCFNYHPQKTADAGVVDEVAQSLGIGDDQMPTYEFLSPNVYHRAQEIIDQLVHDGYDTVEFWDFAPSSDFNEVPAIAVLRAGVLSEGRTFHQ